MFFHKNIALRFTLLRTTLELIVRALLPHPFVEDGMNLHLRRLGQPLRIREADSWRSPFPIGPVLREIWIVFPAMVLVRFRRVSVHHRGSS